MIQQYLSKAMEHAWYEIMEDGTYYGEIPVLRGVWAQGKTLEECRRELLEVAEVWLLVKLREGDTLPVVAGVDLNVSVPAGAG